MLLWLQLFLGILLLALFIYVPGFLLLKAARFDSPYALAAAPIVSIVGASLLARVWVRLETPASWVTLVLPLAIAGAVAWILVATHDKRTHRALAPWQQSPCASKTEWLILAAGIAMGCILTLAYYVLPLDGPLSFVQSWDNWAHPYYVRKYMETGFYGGPSNPGGYPDLFHLTAALVGQVFGWEPTMAINCAFIVSFAFMVPSFAYLFLRAILGTQKGARLAGGLIAMTVSSFPWYNVAGALDAYVFSTVMVLGAVSVFMRAIDELPKRIAPNGVVLILAVLGVVIAQPASLFSCVILMTPFCLSRIWHAARAKQPASRRLAILSCIAFMGLVVGVWTFFYLSPLTAGPRSFNWALPGDIPRGLTNVFGFALGPGQVDFLAMLFCLTGILWCLVHKKQRWLIAMYVLAACFYVVCYGSPWPELRLVLCGFWYRDVARFSPVVTIAAIPLMALGIVVWFKLLVHGANRVKVQGIPDKGVIVVVCVVVALAKIWPYTLSITSVDYSGLGAFGNNLKALNSLEDGKKNLSTEEIEFLQQAAALVPDDEVMINIPYDGTGFAPGVAGVSNIMYEGWDNQSIDNREIPASLDQIASSPELKELLKEQNAHYLVLLDQGTINDQTTEPWQMKQLDWSGINDITDDTPGFVPLLAKGDMRLYRIELE